MPWREVIFTDAGGVVYPASWDMNIWQAREISKRHVQLALPGTASSMPPPKSSDHIAIQDSQDLSSAQSADRTG